MVLRINLRILILCILPFAHILFPLIILVAGIVASFGYFVGYTISCVFQCENWLKPYNEFPVLLKEYWKQHIRFVEETIGQYDHRTGIPHNWDGRMYGLPFGPAKAIFGFLLTLFGMINNFLGTLVIITIKCIPMFIFLL